MRRINDKIELSATWVFGSGNCVTIPVGIYNVSNPVSGISQHKAYYGYDFSGPNFGYIDNNDYFEYGNRNGYRMAPYHRLDLSISFIKKKKWGERRWIIGLFNAYCRKNPYYISVSRNYTEINGGPFKKYVYKQYSLFPIIPSISYQFKF